MAFDAPLFGPDATGVFVDRFAAPDITPSCPTTFALGGVPFVRLVLQGIYGTLTVGPSAVPIRLSPPVDGVATIDVGPGNLTLDAISSMVGREAQSDAVDPRAILPASLVTAIGGAVVSHVRVRVDLTGRRLTAVGLDVIGDQPWTLLPGRLAVTDLNLSVNVLAQGAAVPVGGAVTGTIALGSTSVPVVASPVIRDRAASASRGLHSDTKAADLAGAVGTGATQPQVAAAADTGWWSVVLDSVDGIPLDSLQDLAGLLDDVGVESLLTPAPTGTEPATGRPRDPPPDPTGPITAVLLDLAIRVAAAGTVESVTVTLDIGSAALPHETGGGSIRRTVVVDRQARASQVEPVVSVTSEGEVHRASPAD